MIIVQAPLQRHIHKDFPFNKVMAAHKSKEESCVIVTVYYNVMCKNTSIKRQFM